MTIFNKYIRLVFFAGGGLDAAWLSSFVTVVLALLAESVDWLEEGFSMAWVAEVRLSSFVTVVLALLAATADWLVEASVAAGGRGFSAWTCSAIFEAARMAAGPEHSSSVVTGQTMLIYSAIYVLYNSFSLNQLD